MYDVKIHLKITIYFKKGEDYSYDLNKTDMRRRGTDVFRGGKPVFIFKWIKNMESFIIIVKHVRDYLPICIQFKITF